MSLEAATFIADLVKSNPLGSDKKSQGDDHIRLIKTVLQNTFPNANKPFTASKGMTKTAAYTVVAGDDKTVISVDTSAGVFNLTLPVLTTADAGWSIDVIKINTGVNNVFLVPAAGTINGFAYVRRTLEYVATRVIWNGGNFYASRPNGGNVGELRHFAGPNLPNDCIWTDGQAFPAANYPELAAALGGATAPDIRGRSMLATDRGRGLIGSFIGGALGSAGGAEYTFLPVANLPNFSPSFNGAAAANVKFIDPFIATFTNTGAFRVSLSGSGGANFYSDTQGINIPAVTGSVGSINNNQTQQATSLLQPSIVMNVGLVAE